MKYNRGLILCVFIMLTYALNISQVCSVEAKRRESMIEYLNGFFSNSDNGKLAKSASHKTEKSLRFREVAKLKEQEKEREMEKAKAKNREAEEEEEEEEEEASNQMAGNSTTTAVTEPKIPGVNPNTTERVKTVSPVLDGWFMISSKAFLDRYKFPPIQIAGNKKTLSIKTDKLNFRINGAYGNKLLKEKLPNDKFFWFRLSGLNLYYSSTQTDINILGAVNVDTIDQVLTPLQDASGEYITTCFTVRDSNREDWKICGMKEPVVKKWFCQMKSFLNIHDEENCPELPAVDSNVPVVMTKTVQITQPIVLIPTETKMCNEGWNYQLFSADWECDCKDGVEQSPIDLPKVVDAIESSIKPMFEFSPVNNVGLEPSVDGSIGKDGNLKILLKENLIRIFADKFGRIVTMDGGIFHATEINLHTPSEHTISGKTYDLEVAILASGVSVGDIAKQITLSFLFEKAPGKYNGFIEELDYFDLPTTQSTSKDMKNPISVNNIFKTDEAEEISTMNPFSFFTYQGSLTAPPCTEDTIIYVASNPLQIGSTAMQLIQEATRVPDFMDNRGNMIISTWNSLNARPVQPLKGRPVFHFDHTKTCGPPPQVKPEVPVGHYEKIRKASTSYFYVNTNSPSGLPNAYVVSEDEAKGKGNKPNPNKK